MGTIHTFPSTLDEKSFWGYKDEHVKLIINQDNFIGEIIKNIGTENYKNLNDIKYAFLVTNSSTIDTLYSDEDLKDWTLKRKGKDYHYYDEEGKLAKSLRQTYSFFSDCW
ncbi:hypothetical protein [Flavobacterium croceum]|nr:hypothetical protein [Flavobacterium croceum]